MTRKRIKALAAQVENGGGTDKAVALALGWDSASFSSQYPPEWFSPDGRSHRGPPPFLTSIDALVAECQQMGFLFTVASQFGRNGKPPFYADCCFSEWVLDSGPIEVYAATPARALCAALLWAVAAKETTDD
jgi:hypothetical protein